MCRLSLRSAGIGSDERGSLFVCQMTLDIKKNWVTGDERIRSVLSSGGSESLGIKKFYCRRRRICFRCN